jgi:lipoate-protein ligase A
MKGRLIIDGATGPRENMAADEALLLACEAGDEGFPALRFYWWTVPTLSLGAKEKLEKAADIEACRELGVAVVRRSTGGRAVLHNQELTYSIVSRTGRRPFFGSVDSSYALIADAIRAGLESMGTELELAAGERRGRGKHMPCFAAPSRHELASGGRKVVGSAQRRLRNAVLQHGSILVRSEPELLAAVGGLGEDGVEMLAGSMVGLEELMDREVSRQEMIQALVEPLSTVLDADLEESKLTEIERETCARLLDEGRFAADE